MARLRIWYLKCDPSMKGKMDMKKIRYAIVGAGWISQEAFMPAVSQTENSEITAIITGNSEAARKLADFYSIEHVFGYAEYDNALESGIFDAVYIALPNSLHADFSIRASRAGIHSLVEKPLATSVAECDAMIEAADKNNVRLMTAYRLHCEPGTVEAVRLIQEGAIGTPRYFMGAFSAQIDPGNHRLKAGHWGGALQDIGVYCLNAARYCFGTEPIEVTAMKGHGDDPRFREVEETICAMLRFPGDAMATFTVSFNTADIDTFTVVGTDGIIEMKPGFRFETSPRLRLTQNGQTIEKAFPNFDQFGAQTAYFSDCIIHGQRPEPDGSEGLADVTALLAIEQAAVTGRPQSISLPARKRLPTDDMVRPIKRTDRRLVL